jgi:hypothetical protein
VFVLGRIIFLKLVPSRLKVRVAVLLVQVID